MKELTGAGLQTIGTILSAISSTHALVKSNMANESFDLWGNILQGTGNAVVADEIDEISLDKLGSFLETTGNMANVCALLLVTNEENGERLNIKGDLTQAIGGSLSLIHALNEEIQEATLYDIYGNLLEVTGNCIQSIGAMKSIHRRERTVIIMIGSWTEALGSVLSFISTTIEYRKREQLSAPSKNSIKLL